MNNLIKRKTLYASVFMLALAASGCSLAPKEEILPDAPVLKNVTVEEYTKVSVIRGDLNRSVVVDSTYTAFKTDKLYFGLDGGRLKQVYVDVGDEVKEGDLLAEVFLDDLMAQVENRQNNIRLLEMKIAQAVELREWAVETQKQMSAYSEYSEQMHKSYNQEITNQDTTISKLNDDLYIEQLRLESSNEEVKKRQLYAKWDGVISYLKVFNDWETTSKEEHFMTLYDPDTMVFVTNGKNSELFEEGKQVSVVVGENHYLCEVISSKDFLEEIEGQAVGNAMYLRLTQEDAQLQNGDRGKITFILEEHKDVLYLPTSAILSDNGKSMVYIEDENGFKILKEITTGITVDGRTIVKSGLNEGDSVIVK